MLAQLWDYTYTFCDDQQMVPKVLSLPCQCLFLQELMPLSALNIDTIVYQRGYTITFYVVNL